MLVYSNDRILSSTGKVISVGDDDDNSSRSVVSLGRYNSVHVLLFLAGGIVLVLLMLFESTIFAYIIDNFKCFKNI